MQIVHYGNLSASTVLIQPVGDHDLEEMETELNEIRKQGKADFQLIAVKVDNWNRDLSPWEASAVFGIEGFGAFELLAGLVEREPGHRHAGFGGIEGSHFGNDLHRSDCLLYTSPSPRD